MSKKFSDEEWNKIETEANVILNRFAENMDKAADDSTVVSVVREWQEHISRYYYDCNAEVYYGIAVLYTADDDYKISLENRKSGLSAFMNKAIINYCVKILQGV